MNRGLTHARRFLFGLVPVRTRGALAIVAVGCVAGTAGCDMTRYEAGEPQSVPACEGIDFGDTHVEPAVYWTFDPPEGSNCTFTSNTGSLTLQAQSGSGDEQPTCDSIVRVNGHGNSLQFDGSRYYYLPNMYGSPPPSIVAGATIAAWISVPERGVSNPNKADDGPTVWPILSTIPQTKETCIGGYELELRRESTGQHKLVFSYCDTLEVRRPVELPLNVPSWGWGTGRWHHVAAVYAPMADDKVQVSLYWDAESKTGSSSVVTYDAPMAESSGELYVGSSKEAEAQSPPQRFRGNIDEIAFFSEPLTSPSLALFSLNTTTRGPGPGGCRWRALETNRCAVVAEQGYISDYSSRAAWDQWSVSTMAVSIDDGDWGYGGLSARLAGPGAARNLSSFRYIEFDADVPAIETQNGAFEFVLAAGDDSCTWYVSHDRSNRYRIDLLNPGFCQTDPRICAFPIDRVEWATIRSSNIYPTRFLTGKYEALYAISRVVLIPSDAPLDWSGLGGSIGPNSLCWRPELFQTPRRISVKALFDTSSNTLDARLTGLDQSGPAIVADLGDEVLDISGHSVVVTLSNRPPSPDVGLVLTLQDSLGTWEQADLVNDTDDTFRMGKSVTHCKDAPDNSGIPGFRYPWQGFPPVERSSVSYIKIQKNWVRDGSVGFTLTGIRLE